jgi:hypothetical protein
MHAAASSCDPAAIDSATLRHQRQCAIFFSFQAPSVAVCHWLHPVSASFNSSISLCFLSFRECLFVSVSVHMLLS